MRAKETTIPPSVTTAPPDRPVPAPRAITGTFSLFDTLTTSTTSSVHVGKTTASGARREDSPSYSYSMRSSGRHKTASAPTTPISF